MPNKLLGLRKMEQARLEAELREGKGKGFARSLRRSGVVPAIVYGHKQEPMVIQLPERRLKRFLGSSGENVIINLEMPQSEAETVMLKEVQIDPVSRRILHVDFMRVSMEERVTTRIPIALVGTPAGVSTGGIQEFLLREFHVECEVGKLPEHIEIEVSSLEVGDQIRVGDVKLDQDIDVLDDPATIIVTIVPPTISAEAAAEEEGVVAEEEIEPEVIREKREEEEKE